MNYFEQFKQDILMHRYVTKERVLLCFECYLIGKGVHEQDTNLLVQALYENLINCSLLSLTD